MRMTRRFSIVDLQVPAIVVVLATVAPGAISTAADAQTVHVWQKVELTFEAEGTYENPYTEVDVWVELESPGVPGAGGEKNARFSRRCYGFWDGGNTFRVRVLATAPGEWTWKSGSNPADAGLADKTGSFTAVAWSDAEKQQNPCRRGMIQATPNGHAFQYADGTPYFLLGDTWWATPTFRFPWRDDDRQYPIGPEAGF
ncbi:MAG: DUF5060 domain-containing protein, partial [Planctomycetota bacterium]